jgi:hypothetical protein
MNIVQKVAMGKEGVREELFDYSSILAFNILEIILLSIKEKMRKKESMPTVPRFTSEANIVLSHSFLFQIVYSFHSFFAEI